MRVLVISDIHANLAALETVLNTANGQFDTIWCLGDLVGYGPRPNECVELIRERVSLCIMGNHDLAAVGQSEMELDNFNPHARHALLWTRETLSEENRQFLLQLPDRPVHPPEVANLLVTHASPREPLLEYILTPNVAWENFCVFQEDICLVGHTHKPAIYRWRQYQEHELEQLESAPSAQETLAEVAFLQPPIGARIRLNTSHQFRLIINPGSVGQPRDNDARAAYALLDIDEMVWQYERVAYPFELTQSQMRAADLPKRLIDRLAYGW